MGSTFWILPGSGESSLPRSWGATVDWVLAAGIRLADFTKPPLRGTTPNLDQHWDPLFRAKQIACSKCADSDGSRICRRPLAAPVAPQQQKSAPSSKQRVATPSLLRSCAKILLQNSAWDYLNSALQACVTQPSASGPEQSGCRQELEM